jgi:hypothetical protein
MYLLSNYWTDCINNGEIKKKVQEQLVQHPVMTEVHNTRQERRWVVLTEL